MPLLIINLFSLVLIAIALLLLIPIGVLLIECISALLPGSHQAREENSVSPRVAVLVPAHDEALGIQATLEGILPQLKQHDRLVVIADNCTDDTAKIARATGATVIERQDPIHRGKGYALDYGIRFLASDPPEAVVVVDADCAVEEGAIARIARQAIATNCPVQALYLMEQPANPKPKDSVSALAFMVKNLVRPKGLGRLGFPCLLDGTGMAFPWSVISLVPMASGNLVEDMQLGIDYAIAGHPASICTNAKVIGLLPQQEHAAKSQRTRWEHGHLQTLLTQVPKLLKAALHKQRLDLLAMALDLLIPPLSLLVMLWAAATTAALLVAGLGLATWLPAIVLTLEGGLILISILAAWGKYGRAMLPAQTLLAVPLYLLWKIPLYFAFLVQPQTQWIRTDRDAVNPPEA